VGYCEVRLLCVCPVSEFCIGGADSSLGGGGWTWYGWKRSMWSEWKNWFFRNHDIDVQNGDLYMSPTLRAIFWLAKKGKWDPFLIRSKVVVDR